MATHQLSITLPEHVLRLIEERVASGEYSSPSEVVADSVTRLEVAGPGLEQWIQMEMPGRIAEAKAHPERLLTIEQMHLAITEAVVLLDEEQ